MEIKFYLYGYEMEEIKDLRKTLHYLSEKKFYHFEIEMESKRETKYSFFTKYFLKCV